MTKHSRAIGLGLGLAALATFCSCGPNADNSGMRSYPAGDFYVEGKVKGESFQNGNFAESSQYVFTLETSNRFLTVYCIGDSYAPTLDSMLNKDDYVKIKIPRRGVEFENQPGDKKYVISPERVVEINGKSTQ